MRQQTFYLKLNGNSGNINRQIRFTPRPMTSSPTALPARSKVRSRSEPPAATLRTWMLYRDEALWAFVGGTETDKPLEEIAISEETAARIAEANDAAKRAWSIAEKIARANEQKASTVMRDALNEVLGSETPAFLLTVPHIPGSF